MKLQNHVAMPFTTRSIALLGNTISEFSFQVKSTESEQPSFTNGSTSVFPFYIISHCIAGAFSFCTGQSAHDDERTEVSICI